MTYYHLPSMIVTLLADVILDYGQNNENRKYKIYTTLTL
jgi:hypothetical protein